jgi:hypothetical protein
MKKKLLILDLKKNYDYKKENYDIITVNRGNIKSRNCKKISFDINDNKKTLAKDKKKILSFFLKIKKIIKKRINHFDSIELEILNLRNDKIDYINKFFVLQKLSRLDIHKYQEIEIFLDDCEYVESYKSIFTKNTKIDIVGNKVKKFNELSILYKYIKFLIRSFLFIKILKKISLRNSKNKKKFNEIYLSLFPNLFKKNEVKIYNSKNINYLNFSLTDETHLGINPQNYKKHIKKISKIKNIVNIENYINYSDLLKSLKMFLLNIRNIKTICDRKYFLNNINLTQIIRQNLLISVLNRYKLCIYENAINKFFDKYKINFFHYFLFEYNFGFFIKNLLFKKVKYFIGYQHGIFTNKTFWMDLIDHDKIKNPLPNKVICNNKLSFDSYKKFFSKISYKRNNDFNKITKIKNITQRQSNNLLVFVGQHDVEDCIYHFINNSMFDNYKIFIKTHPNYKKKITIKNHNLFFVSKINFNKKYRLFLSPTTTLVNQFKKNNIFFNVIKFNFKLNLCD